MTFFFDVGFICLLSVYNIYLLFSRSGKDCPGTEADIITPEKGIVFLQEMRYNTLKWGKGAKCMICSIRTLGITGILGCAVTAECYISNGLPGFDIVGLPDAAVKEARERVRAAAKNSGQTFPASRITVNLAPANLKKSGTHYDLPILLSILCAAGSARKPKSTSAFLGK